MQRAVFVPAESPVSLLETLLMLNSMSAAELGSFAILRRALTRRKSSTARGNVVARLSRRNLLILIGFALVIFLRATTNLASAGYAPAHWCVMINLCTPFVTAAIGTLVFKEPLPKGTVVALVVGLGGSALAIFGGVRGGQGGSHTSPLLGVGIGIAFGSSCMLAIYQHIVRRTKGLFTEDFVLALNYAVVLVPTVAILVVQQCSGAEDLIGALGALGVRQWVLLILWSAFIYLGAMRIQALAIRSLGPTLVAAVMPLRLISSVVGSYALLDEGIASPMEAAGLAITALTATAYLGRQVMLSRKQGARQSSQASVPAVPATISVELQEGGSKGHDG